MKPATGVVLLLAVVVALYFVALGLGLAFNRGGDGTSVDDVSGGWKKALGALTPLFAPPLDLRAVACNGQPVTGLFKLTEGNAECSLEFTSSDDDYRKGELEVLRTPATNDLAVLVRAEFNEKYFHREERDKSKCFVDPAPLPGALPGVGEIPYPDEVTARKLRLQIRYLPNGDSDPDTWKCWLLQDRSEPFGFTVLADGGSLALECVGCAAGAQRELLLRLK
jgi:hypothetical protein